MKAYALYEGTYSVDKTKEFNPFDPKKDRHQDRPGSLFINVQPFLIDTEDDLILLDTGLGYTDADGELLIHNNLKKLGYSPDDVTKVLMSHLHIDHSGGMVKKTETRYEPAFPQAEYYVQREGFEYAISHPSKTYYRPMLEAMQRSGNLELIEGNGTIGNTINYEFTGAHSPYHQIFLINKAEETYFFGGDVLPEPEQLLKRFAAKYDFDGRKAMELRQQYGEKAAENNWTCLFYHSEHKAMGKVSYKNDVFSITEVKQDMERR